MSKQVDFYRQCRLQKKVFNDNGKIAKVIETVSWLPEQFAIVGKMVSLRNKYVNDKPEWSNHWEVLSASEPLAADIVEKNSRDYKWQRNASDVVFSDIKKYNDNH